MAPGSCWYTGHALVPLRFAAEAREAVSTPLSHLGPFVRHRTIQPNGSETSGLTLATPGNRKQTLEALLGQSKTVESFGAGEVVALPCRILSGELPRSIMVQMLHSESAAESESFGRRRGFTLISRIQDPSSDGTYVLRGIVPKNCIGGTYVAVGISYSFHDGAVKMETDRFDLDRQLSCVIAEDREDAEPVTATG